MALSLGVHAQVTLPGPGIINTLAGNGTACPSSTSACGNGGLATSAELNNPRAVAVDASGNFYVADQLDCRIRKVTASTDDISLIAGNGSCSFSGDSGLATSAELNNPFGVVVDAAGNVYIADEGNCRIRKVTSSTGDISTIAGSGTCGYSGDGGLASSAKLNSPSGVALDGNSNIYIADEGNNRIRVVNAGNSVITVAGISINPGDIQTIAGNGTACSSSTSPCGDNGLATNAQLNSPQGVAVDSAGDVYLADSNDNRVRKVSSAGDITRVAGNGVTGSQCGSGELNSPTEVAVDAYGDLLIADYGNQCILEIPASTTTLLTVAGNGVKYSGSGSNGDTGPATNAELDNPYGVAVDSLGNIYIADTFSNRVRAVGNALGLPRPGDINTVAGGGSGSCSSETDSIGDGCPATDARFLLYDVAVGPTGSIYVVDGTNNRIRTVTPATALIATVAGGGRNCIGFGFGGCQPDCSVESDNVGDGCQATVAYLANPRADAVDSSGNVYIADAAASRIREVTASTGVITAIAGNGTAGFSGDGGLATSAELNEPARMALDSAGNVYIADLGNNRIRVVNTGSSTTTIAGISIRAGDIATVAGGGTPCSGKTDPLGDGCPATSATLSNPTGVAVDGAGNIYIADSGDNVVRIVTASPGNITTVAGSGSASYSGDNGPATSAGMSPFSVALDSASNIYISDIGNSRIRVVNTGSAPITIAGVTINSGDVNTVAGTGTAGYSGDGGPATSAELGYPRGIAVGSNGNIYIADFLSERIRVVVP